MTIGSRARLAGFSGELLDSGSPGYDDARRIWNRMIDRRPALIARVRSAEDARVALAYARAAGLPVAVRGAGHNVAGTSLVDGGVVIDHSLRRAVSVDPATRLVSVEPGATLGEMDAATRIHGLAVPTGINTTTGVAGLTLGGGIGWLMRAHGLSCDHLVAAQVLTHDGRLLEVDGESHPDLLWGLRGGGGNFGIVTRFTFRAVPLRDPVLAGMVYFPMQEGTAVLRRYAEWAAQAPRSVTTIIALRTLLPLAAVPGPLRGRRIAGIGLCSIADPATDEALLREIRGLGTVIWDTAARKPFAMQQSMFDPGVPAGHGYYWKSHYLDQLSDGLIDVLVDHHLRAPQPWSYSLVAHLGGAIADVGPDETAYVARRVPFLVNINGVSDDVRDDEAAVAWARGCFDATAPFSTGGVYVNFLGAEGEARVRAAYGPAYERLAALKARWDPANVFSTNQNIAPAGR